MDRDSDPLTRDIRDNVADNQAEVSRWNNADWVQVWPKRERLTDPITPFLLEDLAPQPGERILDVGCGGGRTTIAIAGRVGPDGRAVGADISGPLAELARRRAADAGVANLEVRVVDVQNADVSGAPFDAATSQFGVMFFDEPVRAFSNIRRHLRPGGRVVMAVWREIDVNPWFFGPAVAQWVPPPPPLPPGKSRTGPFSLGDPTRVAEILGDAGFTGLERTPYDVVASVPRDAVFDDGQLRFAGIPEEHYAAAAEAVAGLLDSFPVQDGLLQFPLAFQVIRARNPD